MEMPPYCKVGVRRRRTAKTRMLRQSNVDMTNYVHNSHKAAHAQFIDRFLPNCGAVADVEEHPEHERVPVRVQLDCQ